MTIEQHRVLLIAGAVVVVLGGIGTTIAVRSYLDQAQIAAEVKAKNDILEADNRRKDQQLAQSAQALKDVQAQQAADHATLEAIRGNQKLSADDVAKALAKYLPVPAPVEGKTTVEQAGKAPVEVTVPSLPSGIIALKENEWRDFTVTCAECSADKTALQRQVDLQLEDIKTWQGKWENDEGKIKNLQTQIGGGTLRHKIWFTTKLTAGCVGGAVIGDLAAHGKSDRTHMIATGAGGVLGCMVTLIK